ncbi:MAG: cohesin domain-containing protein [Lachnospiraceae bacterium]
MNEKMRKSGKYFQSAVAVFALVLLLFVLTVCRNGESSTSTSVEETITSGENISKDKRIVQAEKSGEPTLIVSNWNTDTASGDTVMVSVTLVNNPGILGMSLALSYDENVMTLKRVENGEAFSGVLNMSSSKNLESGCRFLWDGVSVSDEKVKDGVVLNLEFEVIGSAGTEKSPIIVTSDVDGIVDNDLNPVDVVIDNGYLIINQKH